MKTLFMHVGLPKTGSSAIQYFLAKNQKQLNRQGLLYPNFFGEVENTLKVKIGSGNGHAISRVFRGAKTGTKGQNLSSVFTNISKTLKRAGENDVLISSEGLYKIESEKVVNRLKQIAKNQNFEIKIIIYLRRQDLALASIHNQKVKRHYHTESLESWAIEYYQNEERLHFFELLNRLSLQFGRENVIPKIFEKEQMVNNDLIHDFLSILGIEFSEKFNLESGLKNPSLSSKSVNLMRDLNNLNPTKTFSNRFMDIEQLIQKNIGSLKEKESLSYELSMEVLQYFEEQNTQVAKNYFGREDGKLFYSSPQENKITEDNKNLTVEELSFIFGGLFLSMDRSIKNLEKKVEKLNKTLVETNKTK